MDCLQCHGCGSEEQEELRPYTRRLRTNDSFAGITRLMPIARADKMVMQLRRLARGLPDKHLCEHGASTFEKQQDSGSVMAQEECRYKPRK